MKRMKVRLINCILCGVLVLGMVAVPSMEVYADRTINEVQEDINHQQEVIEGINDEIDSLMGEQDILLEQMDDLNAEIINVMTSIDMLTDEIAQKEEDIKKISVSFDEEHEFKNIKATNCHAAAAYMFGLPEQKIKKVGFENVSFTFKEDASSGMPAMMDYIEPECKRGLYFNCVKQVNLKNVTMSGQTGDRLITINVDEVSDL